MRIRSCVNGHKRGVVQRMVTDAPSKTRDVAEDVPDVGLLRRPFVLEGPDITSREECLQLRVEGELVETIRQRRHVPPLREIIDEDAYRG